MHSHDSLERSSMSKKFLWANLVVFCITGLLLFRVWFLQIYKGDYYQRLSENNRIRYVEVPAPRGVVYDRSGKIIVGNRPYYDLAYIPQYVEDRDTTLDVISNLLNIDIETLERRLKLGGGLPKFLPITLKRNLSLHEVALVQSNKVFLPGIDVTVAPGRDYKADSPAHLVGYLGEINRNELNRYNGDENEQPYRPGDLIGKHGLEYKWESYLRGKRGNRLIQVDAFGRKSSRFANKISLPTKPAIPGSDLILTIDSDLQQAATNAFKGKNGAVVVMSPKDGQVLAMVSEPNYDPRIFQGGLSVDKYRALQANPYNPFLDKTTGGKYAPGSIFKAVVAMAALEEGIVNSSTKFHCSGKFQLGEDNFHCHQRTGHGWVNLRKAMMKSCDVYFYQVGGELGVDRISRYAREFGVGKKLGFRLNTEVSGLMPTSAWKKLTFRVPWTSGDAPPVSIGQGAVEMTPMQMVSMFSAIGNGGDIWRPFLIKKVVNHLGETIFIQDPQLMHKVQGISERTFKIVRNALKAVVEDDEGTGKLARVKETTVSGKTGTAQVVSLKRNITELDVSMKWYDHAIFAAYSPSENPEIAVAVVSENDKQGGGGKAAAPVAGKIIEAYWNKKNKVSERDIAKK